jgi:hypothetical protein
LLKVMLDKLRKLGLFKLRKGVGGRMFEAPFPVGVLVREGSLSMVLAPASLPFVLCDVECDAVKVGGDLGVAAKVRQGAKQTEEVGLGEVFEVRLVDAGAGKASEGTEDHLLVVGDDLLEVELSGHGMAWDR